LTIQELLDEVLKEIRPTKEEIGKALSIYEDIKEAVLKEINIPYPFKIELEGSVAKGTALSGELDLDIFLLIKYPEMGKEWIIKHVVNPLVQALSSRYRTQLRYASHPYIRVLSSGVEADIVPAYWADTVEEIKTAVDRTPFHTRYIKKSLTESQKDEARLLKKFFKGVGIYGAEIRVQGFSGYLSELLIVKYGDFLNTLRNIGRWRLRQVITVGDVDEDPKTLRLLFRDHPLVIPDPVDPRRNAAAAVSRRSLAVAIAASTFFLRSPTRKFFFPKPETLPLEALEETLRRSRRRLLLLLYGMRPGTPPDVSWGELRKVSRKVLNMLKEQGYEVIDWSVWSNDEDLAAAAIDIDEESVEREYEVRDGPRIIGQPVVSFISKYLNREDVLGPWISQEGIPKVLLARRRRNPVEALKDLGKELSTPDLEVIQVTDSLEEFLSRVDVKDKGKILQWLTEAVVKTPSWLGAVNTSGSDR